MQPKSQKGSVRRAGDVILYVTYINTFLYAVCYQIQRPIEPFLVDSLQQDGESVAEAYGRLQSTFSAIQTVGSPLVGILLDRWGLRKASAIVFLASALSYAILAHATNMNLLFWSKVPTALQHAFLIAQAAAATSTTDDAARAAALGRMTTAYTLGATVGPYMGGQLAGQGNLYRSAQWAVGGSLLSVALSIFCYPDTKKEKIAIKKRSAAEETKHAMSLLQRLWPLLTVKVVGGVAASMHSTVFPLILTQDLSFDPAALGKAMSTTMLAVAVFGAFGMSPLIKAIGAPGMAQLGILGRSGVGLLFAWIVTSGRTTETSILSTAMVHGLLSHCLATGLTTQTTGQVGTDEQGTLLGLEHGLFSLARVAGPTLGTMLLSRGIWNVEASCAIIDILLLLLLVGSLIFTKSKPS